MHTYRIGSDVTVLNDHMEIPGLGYLPVNAFVLHAREPVVIDTGLGLPDRHFVQDLGAVMDPADVRWIWLTHPDRDHTGGLFDLLEAAPNARVITTFLGVGIMSTERPLPLDRVYLLNPGQQLDVGDRTLHAFRPPLFDSPATVGFYDDRSRVCFSSDCFGAPLPSAELATGYRRPRRPRGCPARRAAAVGHRRQPLGARGRPERVPPQRAGDAVDRRRRDVQQPPAAGARSVRGAVRHARGRTRCRSVRRPRPAGARADARQLRAGGRREPNKAC